MITVDNIIIAPPDAERIFDPSAAFGDDRPFELEIGCGKGGFLLRRAQANPDGHFLGIEWANKFFSYAADRMARWSMANVRIMRTDARHFVIHHLPPSCLSALHIYHPDPWPKKRHHKRRLFQDDFVNAACKALIDGGRLAIQTDHADYFEWIKEKVEPATQLERVEYDDPQFGIVEASAATNFEIKYRREGRPIYQLAYQKRSDQPG